MTGNGCLFLHCGTADTEWLLIEEHIILNAKSSIQSRFTNDTFLIVIASTISNGQSAPRTEAICNITVLRGEFKPPSDNSPDDLCEWITNHHVYTLPLSSAQLFGIKIALTKELDVICLGCSYRNPSLNELCFISPKNGKISRVSLKRSGCPVTDPSEKEARRYSLVNLDFSVCGCLLFGLTEIGSLFCASVLGSLLPLVSPSNGYSNGLAVDFMPISPLVTLDNSPLKPHRYSLTCSSQDSLIVVSDGYLLHLIKYPNLKFNRNHVSHPFLSQLIAACDDILHRVTTDPGGVKLFRTQSMESVTMDGSTVAKKSTISTLLKTMRNRLIGKRTPKTHSNSLKLKSSNIHLDRFGGESGTVCSSGSESSDADDDDPTMSHHKIGSNLKSGRLDFGALLTPREHGTADRSLDRRRAELFTDFRATLRSAFGIGLIACDLSDDESAALIDVVAKFCEVCISFVNRYKTYAESILVANYALIVDLTQLCWWDAETGHMADILTETLELLFCVNGELTVTHLQSAPWPVRFHGSVDEAEAELETCYKIGVELELVRSSVYKLLCEDNRMITSELHTLKNLLFKYLSTIGVVPLQLPHGKQNLEYKEDRAMSLHLAEYEISFALALFCHLLRHEIDAPGSSTEAQSAAMALFVIFLTSYFSRAPIIIPSPTSPRHITLEAALVRRAIDVTNISHVLTPSLSLSLMLLIGDFPCAANFCLSVNQTRLGAGLLTLTQLLNQSYNSDDHYSIQSTLGRKRTNLYTTLSNLALSRIGLYFDRRDQLNNNKDLPRCILSTLLLSSVAKIDLPSLILNEQIRKLLFFFNSAGAGEPESGPFAPLVLAQPGISADGLKEEHLRAKIAARIQFCFAVLNAVGVDRKFCIFFGKKIGRIIDTRHGERDGIDLFLSETEHSTSDTHITWDSQTKTLFALLRVLFSFLWMFFCRDQYRRAAHQFGAAIRGKSDVADDLDCFYNPVRTAEELLNVISRLYEFSDVLGLCDI